MISLGEKRVIYYDSILGKLTLPSFLTPTIKPAAPFNSFFTTNKNNNKKTGIGKRKRFLNPFLNALNFTSKFHLDTRTIACFN